MSGMRLLVSCDILNDLLIFIVIVLIIHGEGWFHNVSLRKHISEKVWLFSSGAEENVLSSLFQNFITLDHVNTTPRRTHLALMIDQGASLAVSVNYYFLIAQGLTVN